jgi:hypothetical protein
MLVQEPTAGAVGSCALSWRGRVTTGPATRGAAGRLGQAAFLRTGRTAAPPCLSWMPVETWDIP